MFPNVSRLGLRCEEVANLLLDKGKVVTTPGTAFGSSGEGHLRLSLATSLNDLETGVERMKQVLEEVYSGHRYTGLASALAAGSSPQHQVR